MFNWLGNQCEKRWAEGIAVQFTPENIYLALLTDGLGHRNHREYVTGRIAEAANLGDKAYDMLAISALDAGPNRWTPWTPGKPLIDERLESILAAAELLAKQTVPLKPDEKVQIIASRHLVGALLLPAEAGKPTGGRCQLPPEYFPADRLTSAFNKHIREVNPYKSDDHVDEWEARLRVLEEGLKFSTDETRTGSPLGGAISINRQASEGEDCLRVQEYAAALKTLFTTAKEGEFCFALFGHWGRGKTHMMRKLGTLLNADNYTTIFFSAWKYPKAPEVWVHLYETFADVAYPKDNPLNSLPRIFRAGITKNGIGQIALFFGILLLAIWAPESLKTTLKPGAEPGKPPVISTHSPAGEEPTPSESKGGLQPLTVNQWAAIAVGVGGITWIGQFFAKVSKTANRMRSDYLTTNRYTEKLGLQAVIGEDLRALLEGWITERSPTTIIAEILCIVCSVALAASVWWQLTLTKPSWNSIIYITIVIFLSLIILFLFEFGNSTKRVLLVIDDLDRCSLDQLLAVMESVKMMIEDPKVSKRVQVAMLIEEDILKAAILEKYKTLRTREVAPTSNGTFSDERLIHENCEKLFSVFLRLPRLGTDEVLELLDKFDKKENAKEETASLPVRPGPDLSARNFAPPQPRDLNQTDDELLSNGSSTSDSVGQGARVGTPDEPVVDKRAAESLSKQEREALHNALVKSNLGESKYVWGPRSVRSLCFRYQLARLLAVQHGIDFGVGELAEGMVAATSGTVKPMRNKKLQSIVAEVSLS